ncbi:MAG TPA: PAS domain S-box protein [Syntrophales bacterium]|nr:PAS domain S-box protein [Syntrophales bacterium]
MIDNSGSCKNWHSLFFENLPDGILYIEDQIIRDCNKVILSLLNISEKKHIIGLHPSELSPPFQPDGQSSREKANLMMAEASRLGSQRFEWVHRHNGGDIHIEVLLFSVPTDERKAMFAVWSDITKRKTDEISLIQSEKKYRALFENATWGIFQSSVEGNLLFINRSMAELFGYDSPEEMTSKIKRLGTQLYVKPSDRRKFVRVMSKKNRVEHFEAEFRKKDGTKVWISINAYAVTKEDGSTAYYEGNIHDVTNRRLAEEKLRISKQFLSDAVNFLPDATFAVNRNKKIIVWNRAMEVMTGVPARKMLGKDSEACTVLFYGKQKRKKHYIMDLLWEPDADVGSSYLRVKQEDEAICAEAFCPALYGGNGAYVVAKMSPICATDGRMVAAIESIRDVTEQKQTEKALHQSLDRFRLLCENVPLGIIQIDYDGAISYINQQFEMMFGYGLCDLQDIRALQEITKDVDNGTYNHYEGMNNQYRGLFGIYCKDGKERIVQTTSSHIGENVEIRTYQDVTIQYKIEAQLRQSQKMEAVGTLAGGIAHDFNNILGAIIGYTEMAVKGLSGEHKSLEYYLKQVLSGCIRARDLVKQILFFSRRTEHKLSPVRISPLIRDSVKLIRASTPSNIKILQSLSASEDTIYADPIQIHQIIMNLCTNAVYAMKGSNGILTVELRNIELSDDQGLDTGLPYGSYVRLTVRDTGIGIESNRIHRIFEPFYTTKPSGEGTGMGLAVVHGIVKSYGGTIIVNSELNKGTIVKIYIPVLKNIELPAEENTAKSIVHGNERILFVDDEQSLVQFGRTMLSELGYHVTTETDSLQALKTFRDNPQNFDLVITDFMMPNMTGYALSLAILAVRPDVPIILSTGYSDSISKEKAKEAGIREFVLKPLTTYELSTVIRRALQGKA